MVDALTRIETAVATLERLQSESTPGLRLVDQDEPAIWTSGETVLGGTICYINSDQQTGDHLPAGDADLIVTLHRTIPAMLAVLRDAAKVANSYRSTCGRYQLEAPALALADAINGKEE